MLCYLIKGKEKYAWNNTLCCRGKSDDYPWRNALLCGGEQEVGANQVLYPNVDKHTI